MGKTRHALSRKKVVLRRGIGIRQVVSTSTRFRSSDGELGPNIHSADKDRTCASDSSKGDGSRSKVCESFSVPGNGISAGEKRFARRRGIEQGDRIRSDRLC